MYLNFDFVKEFIEGNYYIDSGTINDITQRDYEDINHAYKLLESGDKKYYRDAILNARMLINFRVTQLNDAIGFSEIDKAFKEKQKLEILENLGIIKPLLIRKLFQIRNDVEYRKETAIPGKEECQGLIDSVWYFYKSTDKLIDFVPDNFVIKYSEGGIEYFLSFEFDFKNHKTIKFRGRISELKICREPTENAFKIHSYEGTESINKFSKEFSMGNFAVRGEFLTADIPQYKDILKRIFASWYM